MGLALPTESASLWNTIHREAVAVAAAEPALAAWMHEAVVNQSNLVSALAQLIAVAVSGSRDEKTVTRRIAERAYRDDPSLIEIATLDLRAPLDRDPACPGPLHVLLHFKGYIALQAYRISHRLWESGRTEFAREVHGRITQALHVSIHPSVTIGSAYLSTMAPVSPSAKTCRCCRRSRSAARQKAKLARRGSAVACCYQPGRQC